MVNVYMCHGITREERFYCKMILGFQGRAEISAAKLDHGASVFWPTCFKCRTIHAGHILHGLHIGRAIESAKPNNSPGLQIRSINGQG